MEGSYLAHADISKVAIERSCAATGLALTVIAAAPFVLAHGGDGSDVDLLMEAPLIQMPVVPAPPDIDGSIAAGEWPLYADHALDEHDGPGATVFLARDAQNVYAALRYEGDGWSAFAWAEAGEGPVQVVSSWMEGDSVLFADAFAQKLDVELENEPDGSNDLIAAARATLGSTTVVEIAFPLEADDDQDITLEAGGIHAFAVAWNETVSERPVTLDEGAQVWLQVFVGRTQDDAAEIHHLFAVTPPVWPNVAPLALLAIGAGGIVWASLRRPEA